MGGVQVAGRGVRDSPFFFVVKSCKRRSAVDGWMDQSFHSPFFLTCGFCSTHIKKKSGQAQAWKSGLAGRRYVVFLWGEKIGGMREAEEEQWGEE